MKITSLKEFQRQAQPQRRVPIVAELANDFATPVDLYQHFEGEAYSFFLESAEGGEKWARFSFMGISPSVVFQSRGKKVTLIEGEKKNSFHSEDPLNELKKLIHQYQPVEPPSGEVPFWGGAVGLVAYDIVRFFEKLPSRAKENDESSDLLFIIPEILLVIDNQDRTLKIIYDACIDQKSPETIYRQGIAQIEKTIEKFKSPVLERKKNSVPLRWEMSLSQEEHKEKVEKIRDYITAGDVTQTVLSIRRESPSALDPLDLYRSLRKINPSPYMFLLKYGETSLVGASPETFVRLEEGEMTVRPIAGTRPRGKTKEEDERLAAELLADQKERAEHIMLVDLGRNDLGRVAQNGTVRVDELMTVERYSHVMHIVSNVRARLAEGKDAFDLLRATFPAGTLSGSAKIRAMEIIDELEPIRRGFYGGAVGYFSFSGNMDMAITIRSALLHKGKIVVQSGGGIVADSDPEKEYQECENKAKAMIKAIEQCS